MISITVYAATAIAVLFFKDGLCLPADLTCTDLDVYETTREAVPFPGTQLPYCSTTDIQCCTTSYFNDLKTKILSDLMAGAQSDLTNVFRPWNESYQQLLESLGEFIHSFIENLPFPESLLAFAQDYLNGVEQSLMTQLNPLSVTNLNFNFTNMVFELTFQLVDRFTSNINMASVEQKQCLTGIIHNHIGRPALQNVGEAMQKLQQIYQALQKIEHFLSSLSVSDSIGYSSSEQCLEALLSLQCERCKKQIPSLCENVCAPVVVGCLSPVQDGLHSQMEALWNVTKQLVLSTQDLINQTLRVDQPAILPATALPKMALLAYENCNGLNLLALLNLGARKRRYVAAIDLPESLEPAVKKVLSLSGVFAFSGNYLPTYCSISATERDCWNGQRQIENGTVSSDHFHLGAHIEDQKDNGVYSFDLNKLHQQAASIRNPTSEFLHSSDFSEVLPANLEIPEVQSYIAPPEPSVTTEEPVASATPPSTPVNTDNIIIPVNVPDTSSRTAVNSLFLTVIMSTLSVVVLMERWWR